MNRRRFVTSAAFATVAFGAALPRPAIAQSPPAVQWRLASSFPKPLATLTGGVDYLCARVAALTDNRFQITPADPGDLAPPLAVLEAVQAGTVEMGFTSAAYHVGKDPAFAFAASLPFGLTSRQQMAWLRQGGGLDLVGELFKANGCLGMPAGNTGAQMGGWYRKEIRTPEDIKGLKIGLAGLGATVVARMGGVPQVVAAGDLAAALEKGTISAAAWTGPYDDEKLGLNKLAKVYHTPGWWAGNETLWAVVNLDKWRDLPATYKAALEAACADTSGWVQAKYDAENPPALRRLVSNGALLRPFPADVLQAAYKASGELISELAGRNKQFARIYDSWKAFRGESYLWLRTADARFETFVAGQQGAAKK